MFNNKRVAALERQLLDLRKDVADTGNRTDRLIDRLAAVEGRLEGQTTGNPLSYEDLRAAMLGLLGHLDMAIRRRNPWESDISVVPLNSEVRYGTSVELKGHPNADKIK